MTTTQVSAYDIGDVVRCASADITAATGALVAGTGFRTVAGVPTDPTVVRFRMRDGAGVETVYLYLTDAQIIRDGAGLFRVDWPVTVAGVYRYGWEGTGAVAAYDEWEFYVRPRRA